VNNGAVIGLDRPMVNEDQQQSKGGGGEKNSPPQDPTQKNYPGQWQSNRAFTLANKNYLLSRIYKLVVFVLS
jgi:hypothetical protein